MPLSQIARVEYSHEESILWRRNRDMAITVRSDVVDGAQGDGELERDVRLHTDTMHRVRMNGERDGSRAVAGTPRLKN